MNAGNRFRRAAMVIACLDRHAADELLDRLPEDHALAIRNEIVSMSEVDSDERRDVIRDFLHPASVSANTERSTRRRDAMPTSPSLTDLLSLDNEVIAAALMHERPSIVAALLASVPGDRAAMVLRLLPHPQQTRIAVVLSQGIVTDEVVINVIADVICDTHAQSQTTAAPGLRHHDALQAILDAMSPQERLEMLRSLESENPMLARRLAGTDSSISDCYC